MAASKQRSAPAPPAPPAPAPPVQPIAGARDWERRDYLPGDSGVDWIDELHAQHLAAVDEFEKSVANIAAIEADTETKARDFRRALRDATASGATEMPERGYDPEVEAAKRTVAGEDLVHARDVLARVATDALAELRGRCAEISDVRVGRPLRDAIWAGPVGHMERRKRELREALAKYERGGIENVDSPENVALEAQEREVVGA